MAAPGIRATRGRSATPGSQAKLSSATGRATSSPTNCSTGLASAYDTSVPTARRRIRWPRWRGNSFSNGTTSTNKNTITPIGDRSTNTSDPAVAMASTAVTSQNRR
jgi:hypothetical protein